jgi:hypothetical protein
VRLTLLAIVVVFLGCINSSAEERRWAEISGGYSFVNGSLLSNASGWDLSGSKTLGWAAGRKPWIAIKGEFSAYHHSLTAGRLDDHSFLIGPHFFHGFSHSTVNAYGLAGISRIGGTLGNHNAFASALGGSFDLDITRAFALRIAQVDYYMASVSGSPQDRMRVSAGLL